MIAGLLEVTSSGRAGARDACVEQADALERVGWSVDSNRRVSGDRGSGAGGGEGGWRTLLAALAVGAGSVALGPHAWRVSARGVGGYARPSAMKGGTSPAVPVGYCGGRKRTQRGGGRAEARWVHARGPPQGWDARFGRPVAWAQRVRHIGKREQRRVPAERREADPRARGGSSSSGRGQGHVFGRSSGGNGRVSAGSVTTSPTRRQGDRPAHGQSHGHGRGHGLGYDHAGANGHGRAGLATSKPHSSTEPPPLRRRRPEIRAKATRSECRPTRAPRQ